MMRSSDNCRLRVQASDRLDAVSARLIDSHSDALVMDDAGRPVGILTLEKVFSALLNRAPTP
jgi:hypothetical protein